MRTLKLMALILPLCLLSQTVLASQCNDGIDNDGDGRIDHNDPSCVDRYDNSEKNNPAACEDGIDNDGDWRIDYPNDPECVSPTDGSETYRPPTGNNYACSDGIDNDGDGLRDWPADPGCSTGNDTSERHSDTSLSCDDGVDNDGDSHTDYPQDPGCSSAFDRDETHTLRQCEDRIDNDGDGKVDYPDDPGCSSALDNREIDPKQCNDGRDNDGDGLTDYPLDDGCSSLNDDSEKDPACDDGIDNDGDGKTDYPDDWGCGSRSDNNETDPEPPEPVSHCDDNKDNDADGKTDHPADGGCRAKEDTDEFTWTSSKTYICAADLDGDGDADSSNEHAACSSWVDGPSCPLRRRTCNKTQEEYTFPNGEKAMRDKYSCPGNPDRPCSPDGNGRYRCTPYICHAFEDIVPEEYDIPEDDEQDNGPTDADGRCLGTLRVFPGKAGRCKKTGVDTRFHNCCSMTDKEMEDTMGADGEPRDQEQYLDYSIGEMLIRNAFEERCKERDKETAYKNKSKYCVYLGEYCAKKWDFVGCVQKAKSYCCFNSMLSRIIHEQGRPQIKTMPGFGTVKRPQCRGFSPEEFQALDFSKIDLSEYKTAIRTKAQTQIKNDAQNKARSRYQP